MNIETGKGATMDFKPCVIIPVYNHEHAIAGVLDQVLSFNIYCFLVDDGSSSSCARVLDECVARYPESTRLIRLPVNKGKGAAMCAGFHAASEKGFTHALQIDADGQHDTRQIETFLDRARECPEAIICGFPVYDISVPKGRLIGRYLTHIWVWINTLSFDIKDSMCGFRIYPLMATCLLINSVRMRERMDFDTDIIVRLHWRGVPVVNLPTAVTYPTDGVSHFRVLHDNVSISLMHTRLCLGMLIRLPLLLMRKFTTKKNHPHDVKPTRMS